MQDLQERLFKAPEGYDYSVQVWSETKGWEFPYAFLYPMKEAIDEAKNQSRYVTARAVKVSRYLADDNLIATNVIWSGGGNGAG